MAEQVRIRSEADGTVSVLDLKGQKLPFPVLGIEIAPLLPGQPIRARLEVLVDLDVVANADQVRVKPRLA